MSAPTIKEYFQILIDTLLCSYVPSYQHKAKRKVVQGSKFYFFDVGVANSLAGRQNIKPKTDLFGRVLEHYLFTELRAFLSYHKDDRPLYFWRSTAGHEVDFLMGDDIAIEVKGSEQIQERHLAGLYALGEEKKFKKKIVVSMDSRPRKIKDIEILPLKMFLEKLWDNDFCI